MEGAEALVGLASCAATLLSAGPRAHPPSRLVCALATSILACSLVLVLFTVGCQAPSDDPLQFGDDGSLDPVRLSACWAIGLVCGLTGRARLAASTGRVQADERPGLSTQR